MPIEARSVERFDVRTRGEVGEAIRREAGLVERSADHLTSIGHTVVRQRIMIPGELTALYTDLWDGTTRELI